MSHVNHNITETFIKTYVYKTLHDIKENPRRSTRNVVDFALNFAKGRFQKNFLEAAQKMLTNKSSAYFHLVQDIAEHADEKKIITFGTNIGYTSCTLGAKTIRELEQEYHCNIPWSLTLITDMEENPSAITSYSQTISQGEALGIYTWLLFAKNNPKLLLPLVKAYPDSAFVLFCHGEDITEDFIEAAQPLNNLMFAVQYDSFASRACRKLRENSFLYSLYFRYHEEDAGTITNGELLSSAEALHPAFTFVLADTDCPKPVQDAIYSYVLQTRNSQKYATIPMDLVYDNHYIDSVISDEACTAAFDSRGNLIHSGCFSVHEDCNLFRHKLSEIFRLAFPKNAETELSENAVNA